MTASVFGRRPDDRPPRDEDWSTGVTISIVAHATLIGALVWGLHWRSSTQPVESSAELWAAIPETAAPPPVEAQHGGHCSHTPFTALPNRPDGLNSRIRMMNTVGRTSTQPTWM